MPPESLYKKALVRFRKATEERYRDEKERSLLDEFLRQRASPEETKTAAESLAVDAGKKWGSKKVGDVEIPASWIANIMGNINNFVAAGNMVMEGAPETAGYAWFAVKLTLSAIQANYELYTFFGSGLTDISEIMIIVRHYDRLYDERSKPNWKASPMVDKLFDDVIAAYTAVLDFSFAIKRHLTAGTLTRIKHGFKDFFGGSKGKFEGKLAAIAELKRKILEESQGAFQDKTLSQLEGVSNVLGDLAKTVDSIQSFQKTQEEWHNESIARLDAILKTMEDFKANTKPKTQWDFALQEYQRHQAALKPIGGSNMALGAAVDARHPKTCTWIFDRYEYTSWEESRESRMLCITGQEGTGKSIMVASIAEKLDTDEASKSLFYLSCGASSNTGGGISKLSYTADSICYTFLSNLYSQASQEPGNPRLLEACNEVFSNPKARKGNRLTGNPKSGKSEDDLPDFADAFSRIAAQLKKNIILVLDGVDKNNVADKDQEDLFGRLKELTETKQVLESAGIRIQILVGCGSSTKFFNQLSPGSYIDMTDNNKVDIETTLTDALAGVRGLTAAEQDEAKTAILAKTGYQFAYLSTVAIPFIREPFQRPLSRRLEALPGGINDTYTNELRKMSPNYVDLLRTTLMWSLLQKQRRELKAGEIMEIFHGVYDVPPAPEELDKTIKSGFPIPSRLEIEQLRGASGPFFYLEQDPWSGDDYWIYVRDQARVEEFCLDRPAEEHEDPHAEGEFCVRCRSAISESNTLSVDSKEGHLRIALTCLRHLNHPLFQKRGGLLDQKEVPKKEQSKVDAVKVDESVKVNKEAVPEKAAETAPKEVTTEEGGGEDKGEQGDEDSGYDSDESADEEDSEETEDEEDEEEVEEDGTTLYDSEAFYSVRYEIQFWPSHLREAEMLWTPEERAANPTWAALMAELDKFINDKPEVFRNWQKRFFETPAQMSRVSGGLKPLHVAAHLGLESWVKHLLNSGANPNEPSGALRNALGAAAMTAKNLNVMRILLEAGADINAENEHNPPPFHVWLWKDSGLEAGELMLKHGADVKLRSKASGSWSGLHYFAFKGTDPKLLDLFLERGADINVKNGSEDTPLHVLLSRREVPLPLLKAFIDHGADVNIDGYQSVRPLQMASLYGELGSLKIIVEADVTELDDLDAMGDTALHEAAMGGHAETLRFLLASGANPTIANNYGQTALHYAAGYGFTECVKAFIEYAQSSPKFALDINAIDKHNRNPFFMACDSKNGETAVLLLSALTSAQYTLAEINKPTSTSRTPLRQAASRGYDQVVTTLTSLSIPDDPALALNTLDTKKQHTPLHRAAWHGHLPIVAHLLSLNPAPSLPDTELRTPLSLAYSQWAISSSESSYEGIISALVVADPAAAANDAELVAVCAANGSAKLLRQLRQLGADLSARDRFGWTPLELARKSGHVSAVEFLNLQSTWRGLLPGGWATAWPGTLPSGGKSILSGGDVLHVSEERVCISGDRPLPAGLERYYYEVTLGDVHSKTGGKHVQGEYPEVAIGFCTLGGGVISFPGWPPKTVAPGALSWGYHADDGGVYSSKGEGVMDFRRRFGPGDTVGCGVDLSKGEIWWTLNGTKVNQSFGGVEGRLFPLLGLHEKVYLTTNFAGEGFIWREGGEESGVIEVSSVIGEGSTGGGFEKKDIVEVDVKAVVDGVQALIV